MKILIYGLNYAPEPTGIGRYTGEMGAWLAARGHAVRVVTAPPYYPAWRIADGECRFYHRDRLDGADLVRCPLWVPRNPTGRKRLLHLASFAATSAPALLATAISWRPQVLVAVSPTFFGVPAAALAAAICGASSWLHIQDLEIDAAFDLGLLPRRPAIERLAFGAERTFLRAFDRVSTIAPAMRARLAAKGLADGRLGLFPNWADLSAIAPLASPSAFRTELALPPGQQVALYSGNLGEKQGLEVLIDAATRLSHRSDLVFVIAGDGAGAARLRERAASLVNVRFLPVQPASRLNALLGLADIHLLPQRADAAGAMLPSKLSGILASGRPVVAGGMPGTDLARAIEGCGLAVAPDDGAAFAAAILDLLDDPGRRATLGAAARARALAEWDRDAILGRFEAELAALAGA